MKTLFADIYNKIRELFQLEKSENTSETATNRLQVILMHDRTKLDPLIMNKMREELIDIFSTILINKDNINPYEHLEELIPFYDKLNRNTFVRVRSKQK